MATPVTNIPTDAAGVAKSTAPTHSSPPQTTKSKSTNSSVHPKQRRQRDEIEVVDVTNGDESSEESSDASEDDAETNGLSGGESEYDSDEYDSEEETSSEDDSSDSAESIDATPAGQLSRRKETPRRGNSVIHTRSETTHWIMAQSVPQQGGRSQRNNQGLAVTRGTTTSHQQTVYTNNARSLAQQGAGTSRGNSLGFNLNLNLNMSFSGLVTGRNVSLAGGQVSYSRRESRRTG